MTPPVVTKPEVIRRRLPHDSIIVSNERGSGSGGKAPFPGSPRTSSAMTEPPTESLQSRVEAVLALIRPAVQEDGGDFELLEISEEGVVKIRFLGACVGCPSSEMTLRDGIARNLRSRVPEVTEVVASE